MRLRRPGTWTLRTRLLAAVVALTAAVCLVVGVVSVLALKVFLEQRVDDQLTYAVLRSRNNANRPPQDATGTRREPVNPGGVPGFLFAPGQSEGTIGMSIDTAGTVRSGVLNARGSADQLGTGVKERIAAIPADERPHSADLGTTLGTYRLLAQRSPGGDVIITGLPLGGASSAALRLALVVTGVSILGLALVTLAGIVIVRITLRPLRRVAATATEVVRLPLDRGEVALAVRVPEQDTDPRTEVGQVGAALNRMLGHVGDALTARHASEARVRQFVADASHELRTPLAAIRGYAELTRRSGQPVAPDIAHALGRVESEALRMTALVEDLLLLARLDEGRPMDHDDVDLAPLMIDTVSDAHAAGPEHRWQLDLPEGEEVVVTGDAARLHQVLANLLANARVHTPPGTTVRVGLTGADGEATLTVQDDGPGIPGELLPEVFERFARGDGSRSRHAGSTGLGLAIVSAVVGAHGGRTEVESEPGRTAFRVHLPARVNRLAPDDPAELSDAGADHEPELERRA